MVNANRILHLNTTTNIDNPVGGIEMFLMNIYNSINREVIQFDFISTGGTSYGLFRDEIETIGGRVYELNVIGNSLRSRIKLFIKLRHFLLRNDYTVLHIHDTSLSWQIIICLAAKSAKIPVRIAHSHSTRNNSGFRRKMARAMQPLLLRLATEYYACSLPAGEYLFGKNFVLSGQVKLIHNGIDASRFVFNEKTRIECREELQVEGKFIVGHVGRFVHSKNHIFLLKIFQEVYKKIPNSCLMLIGIGELQDEIKQEARSIGLDKAVLFLNEQKDISKYYQAMDVFVFPSHQEGLGIVAIEAQAAGLKVIVSNSIPKTVKITDSLVFLALEEGPQKWADAILTNRDNYKRLNMKDIVENAGYSNKASAQKLQSEYLSMISSMKHEGKR